MNTRFVAYTLFLLVGIAIPVVFATYYGGEVDTERFGIGGSITAVYVWYLWLVIGCKFPKLKMWSSENPIGVSLSIFFFMLATSLIAVICSLVEMPYWIFIVCCIFFSVGALLIISSQQKID